MLHHIDDWGARVFECPHSRFDMSGVHSIRLFFSISFPDATYYCEMYCKFEKTKSINSQVGILCQTKIISGRIFFGAPLLMLQANRHLLREIG